VSECIAHTVLHTLIPLSSCPSPVLNPAQAAYRAGPPPACRSTRRLARAALSRQPASCRRHASHASDARASRCIGAPDAHPTFSSHFHLLILPILSPFLPVFFFLVFLLCQWFACCFSIRGRTGLSLHGTGLVRSMSMGYGLGSWMSACMETDMSKRVRVSAQV
jgi:hypothetical protein